MKTSGIRKFVSKHFICVVKHVLGKLHVQQCTHEHFHETLLTQVALIIYPKEIYMDMIC